MIKLAILSHTMLGRQVTYNSIIFISVDYYNYAVTVSVTCCSIDQSTIIESRP